MTLYLNDHEVPVTQFPDKTSQVWKLPEAWFKRFSTIRWNFSHEGEIVHLAQLEMLLRAKTYQVQLLLDYLPYGRQDKHVANDTTFALHAFATLINAIGFDNIVIIDPHSDEAMKLITNAWARYPLEAINGAQEAVRADLLAFPDLGACAKYVPMLEPQTWVEGSKTRTQSTGDITDMAFQVRDRDFKPRVEVAGSVILIVDDICDGGATFVRFADALYKAGAAKVHLYVSHGLFTKGLKPLRAAGIERIFTKNGEVQTP